MPSSKRICHVGAFSLVLLLATLGSLANGTSHCDRARLLEFVSHWETKEQRKLHPSVVCSNYSMPRRWRHSPASCEYLNTLSCVSRLYKQEYDPYLDYRGLTDLFFEGAAPQPAVQVEYEGTEQYPIYYGPQERPDDFVGTDEYPIYYGPQERPVNSKPHKPITVCDPSNQMIYNREKRVLGTGMVEYEFPYLDFVGFWNITRFSSEQVFAKHSGFHFHKDNIVVQLPETLVEEMAAFWAHKMRDDELQEFAVSVSKCRRLCSELDITAAQHHDAIMYAPVLAYIKYWDRQQNVSRVLTGSYLHSGLAESLNKTWQSAIKLRWLIGSLFVSFLLLLVVIRINVVEPQLTLWCHVESSVDWMGWLPVPKNILPLWLLQPSCMIKHNLQTWLVPRLTFKRFFAWLGCMEMDPSSFFYSAAMEDHVYINVDHMAFSVLGGGTCVDYLAHNIWISIPYLGQRLIMIIPGWSQFWSLSRLVLNALMHALNGNIEMKNLVNSAFLPRPKSLKLGQPSRKYPGGKPATIRLCDGDLRKNLTRKDPEECRGKTSVYGFDTEQYSPEAFASNQHNEEQALYARVLAETIKPSDELPACIKWAKDNHAKLFPQMHSVKSVSFDVYISRSNASPSVKRILRKTYADMCKEGYDEDSSFTNAQLHAWTTRSSFVKVENNLYRSPLGVKDKAPRLIQGARPEFIVIVGPWIMAAQDLLKRRWNGKKDHPIMFTSGLSSEVISDFISEADGQILEDDLGKFDCTIRRDWCEYEVWLCEQWQAPRAVLALMRANINTHGYTHHGWKYACDGTRKSGDPYTSLMNSVINGLSHLYIFCKVREVTVDEVMFQRLIVMAVQGDDNIMRHAGEQISWQAPMGGLGFESEAKYRANLDTAEFCSNRFYRIADRWLLGPKPGRVLAKLGYIVNVPANVSRESMMRGVALGLRKNCNFIPPIRVVLDRVLTLTQGHQAWFQRGYTEHVVKVRALYEATVDVGLHLSEQYEWNCEMQRVFETVVNGLELGESYNCAYADLLFDRDTSGPQRIFGNILPTATFDVQAA